MGFLDNIFGSNKPVVSTTPDFSFYNRSLDIELDDNGQPYINPEVPRQSNLDHYIPSRITGSREVTPEGALGLPAVWRAVSVLSTAVAQLNLEVRRYGTKIDTPNLIAQPDSGDTLSEFLEDTVVSLALHGNCYWRLFRDANGVVFNIEVLNPLAVTVDYDQSGNKFFRWAFGGKQVVFNTSQMTHIRLLKVPGQVYGFGPIQTCRSALVGAQDLTRYKDNWFSEASVPTGLLTTADDLDAETAQDLKNRWEVSQSTRGVAVMSNGVDFKPIILNPADAQFLESQQFSITDIARIFGIPAGLLLAEVNGNSMTYTNQEQSSLEFVRFTLMQYLKKIEDALSNLLVRGQTVHFNLDGLLRPDSLTRAQVQALYITNKIKTPDEVRAEEGMAPLTTKQKNDLTPKPVAPPVVVPADTPPSTAGAPGGATVTNDPTKVNA